ncbi:MAG: methyltransferase domain-containing protein [Negativicutes bacterium]|nr:methyltransferase domain-containing protein [Negativicutes bacterium]
MTKLNLGCGESNMPGYLRVDINPNVNPDVLHDLNVYPYPFAENQFDEVWASHIIEHLNEPGKFLLEVYRITKPGGSIILKTPHYTNVHSFSDFTHKWHLSTYSFEPGHIEYFSGMKFDRKVTIKLRGLLWKLLGFELFINNFEWFRRFWERHLAFIIRATDITVVIQSKKPSV